MFIFPLIYIISFFVSAREIYKGNNAAILIFLIFGLAIYTTAMSVVFMLGLKDLIIFFQFFKEIIVLSVFVLNIIALKHKPKFHLIDYLIFFFFLYTVAYAILPIGTESFVSRLIALKSTSFYIVVYFTARLFDPEKVYVNKYFNYILLLTIAAGAVLVTELVTGTQLQTRIGFMDYIYYFFNVEPSGSFGLTTTFESDSGYRRFASFFQNPLELAGATLIALSIIISLNTRDNNKLKLNTTGVLALCASVLCITFSFSRAPLASYFLIIYIYALITHKKFITNTIHIAFGLIAIYFVYLFFRFEDTENPIIGVIMNTIDFSDPSSVGHLAQWFEGIMAMIEHPLGLGLGTSGRVAATISENIGGENQFIIIGVQTGIIGLILYLVVFIMFIKTSLKWLPNLKGKEKKVCMAVLLIKIGFIIPSLTSEIESSSYISYINWFLSGLLISIIMQPKTIQPAPNYVN